MLETKPTINFAHIVNELSAKFVFATNEEKDLKLRNLQEALELSAELHKDQTRPNKEAYINHVLRVTKRLTEEYGVTDPDVVIAALLHDSVEDQSIRLSNLAGLPVSRKNALSYITNAFGSRVAFLVENLSNEEITGEMSDEEWNKIYAQHVEDIIEKDDDLMLIKLSDFSDNALKLGDVQDVARRLKLGKKYLPTMQVFVKRIKERSPFSDSIKTEILKKLNLAIAETSDFINKNS